VLSAVVLGASILGHSSDLEQRTSAAQAQGAPLHVALSVPALRSVVRELPTPAPAPILDEATAVPAPESELTVERPGDLPVRVSECSSDHRLVASAVNASDPRLSRVVVRNAHGAFVVGIGGRVGSHVVESIEPTRAQLRDDNGPCALTGFSALSTPAAPPPPKVVPPAEPNGAPKGKAMFTRDELSSGVRPLGGGQFSVSRELLVRGLANPGGVAGGAWFRPHTREAQTVGMEVRAVREGTPLAALGMRTGDIARTVNGISLDSPQGLLEVLRSVREAQDITIAIDRDGRRSELRYLVD
jgi:general secretion pathway protein C